MERFKVLSEATAIMKDFCKIRVKSNQYVKVFNYFIPLTFLLREYLKCLNILFETIKNTTNVYDNLVKREINKHV